MTKTNDGGTAFPAVTIEQRGDSAYNPPTHVYHGGMTLRDWFAGMALQGLISHYGQQGSKDAAINAFELADALLAERVKGAKCYDDL